MAKKRQTADLTQICELDETLQNRLSLPYAVRHTQLQLFDGFLAEEASARQSKQKWNWQDELLAQLLARGYSHLEAYQLSHKDVKTTNPATLYPNASRACNRSKIQARVEAIKRELQDKALMSTTEYFSILNDMARIPSKNGDRAAAMKMIGQIKGVFQAEKGLPGSDATPFVVTFAAPVPKENAAGGERAPCRMPQFRFRRSTHREDRAMSRSPPT